MIQSNQPPRLNNDNRRQLFLDIFQIIDDNQHNIHIDVLMRLNKKLQDLYIQNEYTYRLCKYWKNGKRCPFGTKCRFQHFVIFKHQQQCIFNKNNRCKHGQLCFYKHNNKDNIWLECSKRNGNAFF